MVGPDALIPLPAHSKKVDWEAELGVVIGRHAKISLERALDVIAGYTIGNDLSARDVSRRNGISDTSPFKFDWLAQKNFDGACPLGPWIVPAADIPDAGKLDIALEVNGVVKQSSNTSQLIFNIAEQISHISERIPRCIRATSSSPERRPASAPGATSSSRRATRCASKSAAAAPWSTGSRSARMLRNSTRPAARCAAGKGGRS